MFKLYGAPQKVHSDEDVRIRGANGWCVSALNVQVSTRVHYTHSPKNWLSGSKAMDNPHGPQGHGAEPIGGETGWGCTACILRHVATETCYQAAPQLLRHGGSPSVWHNSGGPTLLEGHMAQVIQRQCFCTACALHAHCSEPPFFVSEITNLLVFFNFEPKKCLCVPTSWGLYGAEWDKRLFSLCTFQSFLLCWRFWQPW